MINYNNFNNLHFSCKNNNLIFSAVFFAENNTLIKTPFIKGFHTSMVLGTDNNTLDTTNTFPIADKEKLLSGLDEIKKNSESMTISEFLSESNTSFSEAFPNYSSFKIKDVLEQIKTDTNNKFIYSEPIIKDVLNLIYENPKSFLDNKDLVLNYFTVKNSSDGSFTTLLKNINDLSEDTTVESKSESSIIKYENGYIILDVKQAGLKIEKSIEYIIKHKDEIEINSTAILPGIGALFLYKNVVKNHNNFAAGSYHQDVEKLNLSEAAKVDLLKMQAKQVLVFNTVGAILVLGSLFVISNTIMDKTRNKNPVTVNLNITGQLVHSPKVETSVGAFYFCGESAYRRLLFLAPKFKCPNRFKYLILFLISLIGLYFLIPFFSHILFLFKSIRVFWVKFVLVLITTIAILYNLITLFLLIKFSLMEDKTIIIPKYMPNFISSYLIDLKRISKYDSLNNFLYLFITTTIFLFILLLIFLFISNIF